MKKKCKSISDHFRKIWHIEISAFWFLTGILASLLKMGDLWDYWGLFWWEVGETTEKQLRNGWDIVDFLSCGNKEGHPTVLDNWIQFFFFLWIKSHHWMFLVLSLSDWFHMGPFSFSFPTSCSTLCLKLDTSPSTNQRRAFTRYFLEPLPSSPTLLQI